MTREEAKELLPIIKAFAEGKEIQYRNSFNEWIDIKKNEGLSFIKTPLDYRIKPESQYRPFKTREECWNEMHKHPDFGWGLNNFGEYVNLSRISNDSIFTKGDAFNFNKALKGFRFTDGTPFGIREDWLCK